MGQVCLEYFTIVIFKLFIFSFVIQGIARTFFKNKHCYSRHY
ncbi:hypothetical protein MCHI_002031 [Candidatus Magnetoovum chiemensis]|nr:hypothetical protein MCHI_002031 [Candidatus Magnetoovum chiemensis]